MVIVLILSHSNTASLQCCIPVCRWVGWQHWGYAHIWSCLNKVSEQKHITIRNGIIILVDLCAVPLIYYVITFC